MKYRYNRKLFLVAAMLLTGGVAMAQSGGRPAQGVVIKGNVYGGCEIGNVSKDTYVQMNGGTMEGSVYGGGMGSTANERQGEVLGNATVKMKGGTVERSIYGGGELGSVGTFTAYDTFVYEGSGDIPNDTVYVPKTCQQGTGFVQVLIEGGYVGKRGSTMPHIGSNPDDDDRGWIFTGCQGEADSITYHKAIALGVVDSTYLEIKGNSVITASVYGGCENGLVLRSTKVKIEGGQIGTGYRGNNVWDDPYSEEQWTTAKTAVQNGTIGTIYTEQNPNPFHECDAWPFVAPYQVYDYYYDSLYVDENGQEQHWRPANSASLGYNGQSFFGKVFGGGSGFYPIAPGVWRRTAGQVRKNTYVEITGGHILTSIYGGNETTDVLGKSTVKMSGGTLGVPRSLEQIAGHPVTCYLFGAGMGDPRVLFNTWTNVKDVEVEVSGTAFFFGSIFGGGEEGHVLDNVKLTVKENAFIGTTGTSYVDGNVFGGGRGFSGEALTAGTVGGDIEVNIEGGTMLGSIYGGGRLASVGTMFAYPNDAQGNPNPLYGHMLPDDEDGTHGHVVVNIKGGTIGNDYETNAGRIKGGNVFGGSMGRLTLMDGTNVNPIWPNLAKVKDTEINISQVSNSVPTLIKGSVFGGSEYGTVLENTEINIAGGTIMRSVFGGGFGSDDITLVGKLGRTDGTDVDTVLVKPTQYSGRVLGNTVINTTGGTVTRLVFGGGDLASVGSNFIYTQDGTNSSLMPDSNNESGHTQVNILGGTFGLLNPSDPTVPFIQKVPYGSIFGAGRGEPVDDTGFEGFTDSHCGFVNKTEVNIGGNSGDGPRIYGSVYGGAQDSYVLQNTSVTVNRGEIGVEYGDDATALTTVGESTITNHVWTTRGNVFGGGSGDSEWEDANHVKHLSSISGLVVDSTNVTVNGGLIHRLVYGGGSLASADGHATVNINSPIGNESNDFSDFVDYDYGGYVFGAGRGETTVDLAVFATTGSTEVNINNGAKVPGNVFGGGALGQVERSTHVNVTGGTVGLIEYTQSSNEPNAVYDGISHLGALGTGSVFGGGMGSTAEGLRDAALVHDSTCVTISGGHVLYSVYGGGEVASVGERVSYTHTTNGVTYTDYKPKQGTVSQADSTGFCLVTIKGGQVGPAPKVGTFDGKTYNIPVGLSGTDGYVFGGGKGIGDDPIPSNYQYGPYSGAYYQIADVNNTLVVVDMPMPAEGDNNANRLWGSIFGGAEDGHVLGNARVVYKNGLMGTKGTTSYDGNIFGGGRNFSKKNYNAGRVRGNISVKMSGGQLYGSIFGGGRLALTGVDMLGNMIEDEEGTNGEKFGNVLVKVNGGVVGNDQIVNVPALGGDVPFIETFTEFAMGDVFGGGKGSMEGIAGHPIASALLVSLVRNTEVIIEDSINGNYHTTPKILGSVFGGGEVANVGRFNWTLGQNGITDIKLDYGGLAKVTINGGQIGIDKMRMDYTLADGDHNYDLKYNTDLGHVFGGGEGIYDNPNKTEYAMPAGINTHEYGNLSLLDLMATVGSTEVTIDGTAWVKGSVFGGSMSGHVLHDTEVTVSGGQIGAGYNPQTGVQQQTTYAENKFFNPVTYFGTDHPTYADVAAGDALHGCYEWEYDPIVQRPFDPIKLKTEEGYKPTNGETWFGSVYGGGSGYYPYIVRNHDESADSCVWNPESGRVFGNATVEITGGHILSNVYGGSQVSDVGRYAIADATYHATHQAVPVGELYCISGGKATVTISGGTVGVPTTIESKVKNPINGDVYGGCQGNIHEQLDLLSNVDSTKVTISETAIVYGSVFGGAENGHVVDSTNVVVNGGIIGTTGLSGEDGHVYGGGQGSYYYANLADTTDLTLYWKPGRIGGNTHVKMSDGKVLGCLYGGGSIAVTGVGKSGEFSSYAYGDDDSRIYDSTYHGRTLVELSGGTIGNNLIRGGYDLLMSENEIGNVYGGGRGNPEAFVEDDFGRVANALVRVTGNPVIYGSVFGGGQMANVGHWNNYASWYTTKTGTTSVSIKDNPTIGSALEFDYDYSIGNLSDLPDDLPLWTYYDTIRGMRMIEHTCTGNVYGAGQGDVTLMEDETVTGLEHGHCRTTIVNIDMNNPTNGVGGGHIRGCVYGGAEQGAVWGETNVTVAGGTIGTEDIPYDSLEYKKVGGQWKWVWVHNDSTYSYGSVYGGSHGRDIWKHFADDPYFNPDNLQQIDSVNGLSGRVYGNTIVNITGGAIRGNVFGGGDMASVGIWDSITDSNDHLIDIRAKADSDRPQFRGNATVTVSGGEIGPLDGTGLNAYVFGGGKGFSTDSLELRKVFANVDSTFVTISGGKIWGSVFGGGNDGHVLGSASVIVHAGANIGKDGLSTWDGNIFGGGRDFVNSNHTNGRVSGNIDITMDGGTIQGSIFGGGRMALTGVDVNGDPFLTNTTDYVYDSVNHGLVTINVSGTTTSIGNTNGDELLNGSDESVGDIFGSGKGDTKNYDDILAGRVANTKITLSGSPRIYGSVFGGGEMAGIGYWREVNGKQVFYGKSGASEVTIGREGENDNPEIGTDYEYTTEYLYDDPEPDWTVTQTVNGVKKLIHTCTGNVFGGSQGDVDPEAPHWVSMGRSRKSKVVVNGGTIKSCVYGGAEQGSIATDTYVLINGGTIGHEVTASDNSTYLFGGVFGGGYGSHRDDYNTNTASNDSTTALGQANSRPNYLAGRVYGNTLVDIMDGTIVDIYGGSNYAYLGAYGSNPKGNTRVNIGRLIPNRVDTIPDGNATIRGMVFGANNHAGTPYGNATVHVYKTAHTETPNNFYPSPAPETPEELADVANDTVNFAIKAVYGASNLTDYTPVEGRNDTVHVYFCDENTIFDVYGGCNAASVGKANAGYKTNSYVIIDGGHINRVFGGGNGEGGISADIHGSANTYVNGGLIHELYGGSNSAGVIETINLYVNDSTGCRVIIGDGFGSNNESLVVGDVVTTLKCGGETGSYANFYGGANLATIYGSVTVNVMGGEYGNLFAGSKGRLANPNAVPPIEEVSADIKKFPVNEAGILALPEAHQQAVRDYLATHPEAKGKGGTVTLNIYGGKIDNAFGGSDVLSNIEGRILVNVIDTVCDCDLELVNVYGAGRYTTYEPQLVNSKLINSPVVNVIHGEVQGNVYGGGKGATAMTKANPVVNIGYRVGDYIMDSLKTVYINSSLDEPINFAHDSVCAQIGENVYGGGHEANIGDKANEVICNTSVTVDKGNTVIGGTVFGGGFGKILAQGETMQPADSVYGLVYGSDTVRIHAGHIRGHVYGGGAESSVERNTYVKLTGGRVGTLTVHKTTDENGQEIDSIIPGLNIPYYHLTGGRVFGGGRGYHPTANYDDYKNFGRVKGNTYVYVSDTAKIRDCVYGGGALASVGWGDLTDKNSGVATVEISGGEIGPLDGTGLNAYVYGGGRGEANDGSSNFTKFANVDSTSVIVCDNARIYGSIFGGGSDGHVIGDATVQVKKNPASTRIPVIGTTGMTSWDGNIFGGGRNYTYSNLTAGRVGGNIRIDMSDGELKGNVYGGGRMGLTGMEADGDPIADDNHGIVTVNISGGTVGSEVDAATIGNVFGGGKGLFLDPDNPDININGADMWGRTKETHVNILGTDTRIYGSVYGGGEQAYTMENTNVTVSGGIIGSELPREDDPTKTRYNGSVYGGGKGIEEGYPYLPMQKEAGIVLGNTTVRIEGGQVMENVFGGGEIGSVGQYLGYDTPDAEGNTYVTVTGGQVGPLDGTGLNGYVYGAGQGIGNDPDGQFCFIADVINTNVTIDIPADADPEKNRIWGSVFGGGADGHVMGDVLVEMKSGIVGTDGTTSWDGNIFGGGRNYLHTNLTAGRVGGNITVDMTGGTLLGSIFGGGRLGVTGISADLYYDFDEDFNPIFWSVPYMLEGDDHGNVTVTVSGGTVGNSDKILDPDWLANPNRTSMGDVFGGGKGDACGPDFAKVKNDTVIIKGTARVLGSVYGGGELSNVGWYDFENNASVEGTGNARVTITGNAQVGIEQIGTAQASIVGGSVYGGGKGVPGNTDTFTGSGVHGAVEYANVGNTLVTISGGYITNTVFGGGNDGHVITNTVINMTDGTVGQKNTMNELLTYQNEQPYSDHIYTGSVIGGGCGITPLTTSPLTYSDMTGRVFGNSTVTVSGGTVRHGVYGGGGLASVGTFETDNSGNITSFTENTGKCTVTVNGTALVGPTKEDLTEGYTAAEIDTLFKHLGGNAGWVYGAGCGLVEHPELTFNYDAETTIGGSAQVVGSAFGGGESGHVWHNAKITVQDNAIIGGFKLHGDRTGVANDSYTIDNGGVYNGVTVHLTGAESEIAEDLYGAGLRRVFRGEVYGGGKGTDFVTGGGYSETAGRVYGNTEVIVKGGTIYNRVYGGGSMASVGKFTTGSFTPLYDDIQGVHYVSGGLAKVTIEGGTIGVDGYNNGDVVGGSRGLVGRPGSQQVHLAYVGSTDVTVKETTTTSPVIKSNVYGGSINGHVYGNATVKVQGGTIGIAERIHGAWHSNVFGGGGGSGRYTKTNGDKHLSITSGRVFGNTDVTIEGGTVYHNVYGGGAIASVGTYDLRPNAVTPIVNDLNGDPTGNIHVTITGGTIGYDGNENGMVFGSGRGEIDAIGAYMDSLSYAVNTFVTIGSTTASSNEYPKVKGSVYGSGENGHVFGQTQVNIHSGIIGCESYDANNPDQYFAFRGNVYGAGCGTDMYDSDNNGTGDAYNPRSGLVHGNTEINITGGRISRNVYGGGAMASVGSYSTNASQVWQWGEQITGITANTGKTIVNVSGGTIGTSNVPENIEHGNVYGGTRGPSLSTEYGFSNMALVDAAFVNISGGSVLGSVYGGGNKSLVRTSRVVNVSGGTVYHDVFGGSNDSIYNAPFTALKTVNMRGGQVKGSVFGGSNHAREGNSPSVYTAFVNISGGVIGTDGNGNGNVYGAGYGGEVNGALCVNIGKTAIESTNPLTGSANTLYNQDGGNGFNLEVNKLLIHGDVFGGSHHYRDQVSNANWDKQDVTGATSVFIDGTGYNMDPVSDTTGKKYMYLAGGVYGSGALCESGPTRKIYVRNYGTRTVVGGSGSDKNDMTGSTRPLTTIQRSNIVLLDNANLQMSGVKNIALSEHPEKYGVVKVDQGLYVTNASGISLGAEDSPVYIDSVMRVMSLWLKEGQNLYSQLNSGSNTNWEWIGIQSNNNTLYRIGSNGTTALSRPQENVILFNDNSMMWVRYHDQKQGQGDTGDSLYYGELKGFFRMRGNNYKPEDRVSFAYARPKLTNFVGVTDENTADGGFLSYDNSYNYFTDNGAVYTKTKQYPYINVIRRTRDDRKDYRIWVAEPLRDTCWYVDGTRGWGHDILKTVDNQAGRYPDKPKKTLFGKTNGVKTGIISEEYESGSGNEHLNFSYKDDLIYVVGALSAQDEKYMLRDSTMMDVTYPLYLYRYPGGHLMSNGEEDTGGGSPTVQEPTAANEWGVQGTSTQGPGANYGAMLNVQAGESAEMRNAIEMRGVIMDGLYGYSADEATKHRIPASFDQTQVSKPLVISHANSTLDMYGGTTLKRGYNNIDASATWLTDSDYAPATGVYQGGGLYVDDEARVNVKGLVTITDNVQKRLVTENDQLVDQPVASNVYLPGFNTHLYITETLNSDTRIGVTSPKRNTDTDYTKNTLSPVAEAATGSGIGQDDVSIAEEAWYQCNFLDDQNWFFVNEHTHPDHKRTTYYIPVTGKDVTNSKTVYFGWTWANVVRKAPEGFSYGNINSAEDMAWLISQSAGMNDETPTNFSGQSIAQTADFDLSQYVWVPIGSDDLPFAGTFDGRGHLIKGLTIDYIGKGDLRYERNNYGLFGYVRNGTVKRTFVVSGKIAPKGKETSSAEIYHIGGLVGYLEGDDAVVSNSEAAVPITPFHKGTDYITSAGGLVGKMASGEIHSSMAMADMTGSETDTIGGLVGLVKKGGIFNSFVNTNFNVDNSVAGGLLGKHETAEVENCYVAFRGDQSGTFDGLVSEESNAIDSCYVMTGYNYMGNATGRGHFTPTNSSDLYGYMYKDNTVPYKNEADTAMFRMLNNWVDKKNGTGHKYARWSRPGLSEINGDYPVLLLDDEGDDAHQGDFRSVGTIPGIANALQYGGPVRDNSGNTPAYTKPELDGALSRLEANNALFVYGDITEAPTVTLPTYSKTKISIQEDVAILDPGTLGTYDSTYVGITFDNSKCIATETPGVNAGLYGADFMNLPRDFHMFSTPLSNAPLGFNYHGQNAPVAGHDSFDEIDNDTLGFYNNPWADGTENQVNDFNWLNGGNPGPIRYWMYGWENSQSQNPIVARDFDASAWVDGYFPSRTTSFGIDLIQGTDECPSSNYLMPEIAGPRYPYGMDFYTWNEPTHHWTNFKRNGPNHWHSDEPHVHLEYVPVEGAPANVNETELIKGRGYMAAIGTETLLQSHGTLTNSNVSIPLTYNGSRLAGWNLVGNPYHGYLDFVKVMEDSDNLALLSEVDNPNTTEPEDAFYVVYNADAYDKDFDGDKSTTAFVYYPLTGSEGGAYAERFLHPHQGFYVKAKEGGGNMKFNSNMLVSRADVTGTSHLRDWRPSYPLVNLYLSSDNGCADITVIEFERPEWGGATKQKELRVGNGMFYAHHNENYYAAFFAKAGVDRVPLWFEAQEDDIFTMKWNTANGQFQSMYLIDNIAGVQYDMLMNNTYTFEGHKRDYPSRFLIVFNVTGIEENEDENHPFAFFDGNQWVVTGNGTLQFIDLHGQILAESRVSGQSRITLPVVADGPYLFRLTNSQETRVQKVIITK